MVKESTLLPSLMGLDFSLQLTPDSRPGLYYAPASRLEFGVLADRVCEEVIADLRGLKPTSFVSLAARLKAVPFPSVVLPGPLRGKKLEKNSLTRIGRHHRSSDLSTAHAGSRRLPACFAQDDRRVGDFRADAALKRRSSTVVLIFRGFFRRL